MATRHLTDTGGPPIAPIVKRKRRASCLDEQERRDRKRAIDREAQRSLREKTKTHIAELERTIQILRDQDTNGATANLLREIEELRAENERLRDVIESVRSVVGGGEMFVRPAARSIGTNDGASNADCSPKVSCNNDTIVQQPPAIRTLLSPQTDTKLPASPPPPPSLPSPPHSSHTANPSPFASQSPPLCPSRTIDLDGMTVMSNPSSADANIGPKLHLEPVELVPEEENISDTPDSPATAAWAPYMSEIFGPGWRCPSPTVLHFDDAGASSLRTVKTRRCR